eukprot:1747097-Prymnesium_polylepis.1
MPSVSHHNSIRSVPFTDPVTSDDISTDQNRVTGDGDRVQPGAAQSGVTRRPPSVPFAGAMRRSPFSLEYAIE